MNAVFRPVFLTGLRHILPMEPEWVSIDVMGCNFIITDGVIVHECTVGNEDSSWGAIKQIGR